MLGRLFSGNAKFSQVPQTEDREALIPDPETSETRARSKSSQCSLLLLFIISIAVATLLGALLGSRWLSNPTPVMRDVDMSYKTVRFNGSLLKENVFRQGAGPEVDAAWTSLGVDYRSAVVPADQAKKSGLMPDQVQVSEKYGGGFPANVEGLHHLHCLNLLRKSLYYNFDYYHNLGEGAFKNSDRILRFHVSHCLDILRQQLMCTVDVAVLGQVWWNKQRPLAYPDFNTVHKCRNFDGVRRWAEAHQAPADVPPDFLKPPADRDVYAEIP
ncbi:MAG: hypothetical protein M1839_000998 [Geoglossum umbratile]|nr:MAG: hypothetical protein M1839_000998 [Geoglossum umbratile]